MRKHMGRVSLVGAVLSWVVLMLSLVFGGLDPSATQAPLLQVATMGAVCLSVLALLLATFALARGPQRIAAAFGLGFSLLFVLSFTGFGFALVALFR